MSDLYDNLLRATDNTKDITTEKYGTITKLGDSFCSVKESESDLEHSNVPIINGLSLKIGDKVVLGFIGNSIYDPVVIGAIGNKKVYSKNEIDKIVEEIEKGEIHIEDYDVGFTYQFGLGGIDDTISIHTFLEKINDGE